jgi:DnaJ homologue, subfamily C, member 28, conserved domain
MTKRKPRGMSARTWIDRQIEEATSRGEFEDLPGAGKPIPDLDKPHDEMWWVKQKLQREKLSYLPPTLALRKAAHDAREAALEAASEGEAREIIQEINRRIIDANRMPTRGPSIMLTPFRVESVLARWRERHPAER